MGFPWRRIADVALTIGTVMVPQIGIAEAAIVGLKKGGERQKNVVDLARVAPQIAEALTNNDLHIHDQAAYEAALNAFNDAYFHLQKATAPKDGVPPSV
jgi:hypothetical protein